MKWILAVLTLTFSFMMGCQCTQKSAEEQAPPAEEQEMFESLDEAPAEGEAAPADGGTEGAAPAEGTEEGGH